MPTLLWMSPFAPRTPSEAGVDCTQSRVQAKLQQYGLHLATLLRQNISYSQLSGAPTGDLTPIRWPFCALSANPLRANANIASAEVVFHRLHSSITLEIWRRDCTSGSCLLAGDCSPGRPGPGYLAPCRGLCLCAWFSARCPVRLVCVTLVTAVSVFWSLSHWLHACSAVLLRLLMEAYHLGAPGG